MEQLGLEAGVAGPWYAIATDTVSYATASSPETVVQDEGMAHELPWPVG